MKTTTEDGSGRVGDVIDVEYPVTIRDSRIVCNKCREREVLAFQHTRFCGPCLEDALMRIQARAFYLELGRALPVAGDGYRIEIEKGASFNAGYWRLYYGEQPMNVRGVWLKRGRRGERVYYVEEEEGMWRFGARRHTMALCGCCDTYGSLSMWARMLWWIEQERLEEALAVCRRDYVSAYPKAFIDVEATPRD